MLTAVFGDLDCIQVPPDLSEIDVRHLSKLRHLPLAGHAGLREVDLRHNHALINIDLTYCTSLWKARLSRRAPVRVVKMSDTAFSARTVSAFIDDIHAAALYNGIHDGQIHADRIAEPTPAAKAKLQELRRRGWTITPGDYGG